MQQKTHGSRQYWHARYQELKVLLQQKGSSFFFTLSSADNYWPQLHSLMPNGTSNTTYGGSVNAVIDNPHITDWFFHAKAADFWLEESLDAEWHWYRFEYQARGSIHAHGCATLKNDPGLCKTSVDKTQSFGRPMVKHP